MILVEQNVLKLNVTVRDALRVQILQALKQLADDAFGLLLGECLIELRLRGWRSALPLEIVVQALACDIFYDQINVVVSLECLRELHNECVLQLLHQHNFTADRVTPVIID